MILRKPYAFFIKHFKLFNIILTILEVYMIYKLSFLVQFLFEYSNYPQGSIGKNLVGSLLTLRVFVIGVIIAFFSFILLLVLSFKRKPVKLYIFMIIFNIAMVIMLLVVRNYLEIMSMQVVDIRTAYAIRDFTLIGMIGSILTALLTSMRSLGFDIKKFEFGQDLHDLNITEEDNEEFEIQFDVDSQGIKRNLNRNVRYFKYYLKEHKLMLIILITIAIGVGSFLIYSRSGIYFTATKVNQVVKVNNFSVGINKSYITDKDYKGNIITNNENTLIIIPIKIKANNVKEKLNVTRFALDINNHKFYHTTVYKDKLNDLGITYNDTIINTEFENYILVFEIPKNLASKTMILEYNTENEKQVRFKIETINLDGNSITQNYNVNQIIQFKNRMIKDGTLIINDFDINDRFQVFYNFCVSDEECYTSYEYIVPNYKSNYDKTILKVIGKINFNDSSTNDKNLYDFINNYGTIIYSIGGNTKVHSLSLVKVLPQKTSVSDTYFIEVLDELKYADHISIQFKLRNNVYVYNLK